MFTMAHTCIEMPSGTVFDLDNPQPEQVKVFDIAWKLSNTPRFAGDTDDLYFVAQHCGIVAAIVSQRYKYEALFHDAPEAYFGDMIRPIRRLCPDYNKMYIKGEEVINRALLIPLTMSPAVQLVDDRILTTEGRIFHPTSRFWQSTQSVNRYGEPYPEMQIRPMSNKIAREFFMEIYGVLTNDNSSARADELLAEYVSGFPSKPYFARIARRVS
jgi:uncharacterized protein